MGATASNAQKGRKRGNGLKKFSNDWQGFVDVTLTNEEKEQVRSFHGSSEFDPLAVLDDLTREGYKVSLSPHTSNGSVIAALTGKSPDCVNYGYTLSAFGPGASEALAAVVFKALVKFRGGRWVDEIESVETPMAGWG